MNKEGNTVSSAIVELKAELFRKQEEFKAKKLNNATFLQLKRDKKSSKSSLWDQQNSGVLERIKKDTEDTAKLENEEEMLARSRSVLEEKAKLYDKIAQSSDIPDEDGSDYYLVDFQKKVLDSMFEARNDSRGDENSKTTSMQPHTSRTNEQNTLKEEEEKDSSLLLASEAFREKLKEKWETEAKELIEKDQTDIHYSNIQFDEIRNHGVGFFQFSKDHEQREAELANLKKLHKQTLNEQARKDSLKNKRKAKLEERLAKVRQRRNIKEVVKEENQSDAISYSEDVSSEVKQESDTTSNIDQLSCEAKQEPVSSEPSTTQDPVASAVDSNLQAECFKDKNKMPVREWDRGKTVFPMQSFVESRRKERESEFAPPAFYYNTLNKDKQGTSHCKQFQPTKNPQNYSEITKAGENSTGESISEKTDPPLSEELPFVGNCGSSSYYPQYFPNTFDYNAGNIQYSYNDSSYVYPPASQGHYMSTTYYPDWSDATYYNSATLPAAETQQQQQPKKPKLSIIDTRFVRNDNLPTMSDSAPLEVAAVTYTPGSFTAAKQKQLHDTTESGQRNQFSSGPLMYAKKEVNE